MPALQPSALLDEVVQDVVGDDPGVELVRQALEGSPSHVLTFGGGRQKWLPTSKHAGYHYRRTIGERE